MFISSSPRGSYQFWTSIGVDIMTISRSVSRPPLGLLGRLFVLQGLQVVAIDNNAPDPKTLCFLYRNFGPKRM